MYLHILWHLYIVLNIDINMDRLILILMIMNFINYTIEGKYLDDYILMNHRIKSIYLNIKIWYL